MTVIKLLDGRSFRWHEYEKNIPVLNDRGKPMFDENRQPVYEQPKPDWFLPYIPAYILTNDVNIIAQIFALKDADPMTVDIINEDIFGDEETPWLNCSIDKRLVCKLNL